MIGMNHDVLNPLPATWKYPENENNTNTNTEMTARWRALSH